MRTNALEKSSLWERLRNKCWQILGVTAVLVFVFLYGGYLAGWSWEGLLANGRKTLWDWMDLLIVPLVLGGGAIWFNRQRAKSERQIALDHWEEEALDNYFKELSDLLLSEKLRCFSVRVPSKDKDSSAEHEDSSAEDASHVVAVTLSLTVLRRLSSPARKSSVIQFLRAAGLLADANSLLARADLSLSDLGSVRLSRVNLSGANLNRANLRRAQLDEAHLSDANLDNASLRGANLIKASLRTAKLKEADLREAQLNKADLHGADLTRTNLQRTNLNSATLSTARLKEANLHQAQLVEASLCGADLTGANLSAALMTRADFRGADLRHADVRKGKLASANLHGADLQQARLTSAFVGNADLSTADLRGADLRGAYLGPTGSLFGWFSSKVGADLRGSNLEEADLRRTNLTKTNLRGARLGGADLRGANLNEADLREARKLTCEQLTRARNWKKAYRSDDLACGAPIPEPPPNEDKQTGDDSSE